MPISTLAPSRRRQSLPGQGEGEQFCNSLAAFHLAAQTAVDVPRAEEKQKQQNAVAKAQEKRAQATTTVEFSGQQEFKEKDLRSAVKEQLATLDQYGLTVKQLEPVFAEYLDTFDIELELAP